MTNFPVSGSDRVRGESSPDRMNRGFESSDRSQNPESLGH